MDVAQSSWEILVFLLAFSILETGNARGIHLLGRLAGTHACFQEFAHNNFLILFLNLYTIIKAKKRVQWSLL
jgi:hypothetical protein